MCPSGVGDFASNHHHVHGGSSFRLRQRPTALDLLINRGLSNWYPGSADYELVWKDEDEQIAFEQKMHVLLKNSHVFQQFKDRVAESESFANPMAARLVLEEFLEQELLFVGKRGVIHRHSELIKHLALTQRSPVASSSTTHGKMSLRKPAVEKNIHQSSLTESSSSIADIVKSDSVTAEELSDSSSSEEFTNSPFWSSPLSGKAKTTVTFSGMTKVPDSLSVPELEGKVKDNVETVIFEGSFVN